MNFTLYFLVLGATLVVVQSNSVLQLPNDGRINRIILQRYDPEHGWKTFEPLSGLKWQCPQPGRQPQDPRSGQGRQRPQTGREPQDPRSGQGRQRPQPGQQPQDPRSGQGWQRPQPGREPQDPRSGQGRQRPQPGRQPQDPRSGQGWQRPQTGREPQDPRSGQGRQRPQTGREPQDPRFGQQPNREETSGSKTDYCSLKTCSSPKSHSLCRFSPQSTGPNCGKVESSAMTSREIMEVLNKHNELRAKVARGEERRGNPGPQPASTNIGPLRWNLELAEIAQAWANQCIDDHDECHDIENAQVGQNLAYDSDYNIKLSELVQRWYDEVKDFNNREVKAFEGVGFVLHYTQLVWATTTEVGCGVVRFNHETWSRGFNRTQLVCNYAPRGNMGGQPVYQTR